jgi:hypothetical protein
MLGNYMVRNPYVLRAIWVWPKTVIHIGGGNGQDGYYYKTLGVKSVLWGEAQTQLAEKIKKKFPKDIVINKYFCANNDIKLRDFLSPGQEKLKTINTETTVDIELSSLNLPEPIMMVVDTDGADLEVLRGADITLKKVQYLILEQHRYWENGDWYSTLTNIATSYGFKRTISRPSYLDDYEDVLYTRKKVLTIFAIRFLDLAICQFKQLWHVFKYHHLSTTYFFCQVCEG